MNDGERDRLLTEVHTDVGWIKGWMEKAPCAQTQDRVAQNETDIAVMKNQTARRNGMAAGLGFGGAILAWIVDHLFLRG